MNEFGFDVSRETTDRFETYADLLRKWNPRINLVAKSTISDLWRRHILDSAQIYRMAPHPVNSWVDLGSGGGFPGLVIAMMAKQFGTPYEITLVESDSRKCAFLRAVIRDTEIAATVINDRIENVRPMAADILSARALADLPALLPFVLRHQSPSGTALLHKGASWKKEVAAVRETWKFDCRVAKSETEEGPVVLSISGVARV